LHEEVSLGAKHEKHENVFCLWTKDDGTERKQDKVKQYTMNGARNTFESNKLVFHVLQINFSRARSSYIVARIFYNIVIDINRNYFWISAENVFCILVQYVDITRLGSTSHVSIALKQPTSLPKILYRFIGFP